MHSQIIKMIKKLDVTPIVELAIAMNHNFAKKKNHLIALPMEYRYENDLAGWKDKYIKAGHNYDVAVIGLDKYGEIYKYDDGRFQTSWGVSLNTSEGATGHARVANFSGPNIYITDTDKYKEGSWMINSCWRCIPAKPTGRVYAIKFEEKPLPSKMVLSFTHDEVNAHIDDIIKKLRTAVQGHNIKYVKGDWVPDTYDAIWTLLSEYRTCQLLNIHLRDKGSDLIWLPVDMRGKSDVFGLNDMKGRFQLKDDNTIKHMEIKDTSAKRGRKWVQMPLYVGRQIAGADLTLHRIGDTVNTGESYPEYGWMDVKLDHYAGYSNRISIETHVYSPERGWEKTGWLWKRLHKKGCDVENGYITYQIDDNLYIFKLTDLVKTVEDAGEPEFDDWTNPMGRLFRKPMGNFHLNTNDPHNVSTGEGKYGYFLSLEDSARLASRACAVLPAMLQDVERRAPSFRKHQGDEMSPTMDKWITRMVDLSKAQR